MPVSSSLMVCFGFVFFDLNFAFDFYFVLLFVLCHAVIVATLPFDSLGFCVAISFDLMKLAFCFSLVLPPV